MLHSFPEALKGLGLWEPHGWSHLDHDCLRLSFLSRVAPWGLRPKTQLCDQITSRKLHGMLQRFSEALKGLGFWEPHGWSHLDHNSLFGQVSLVTLLSLQPSCCFGRLLLFGPKVAGWSHFALGPFGHVCLFGAGPLLKHISLFGPFGHVSVFAARSRHGSQGPKQNFVIK